MTCYDASYHGYYLLQDTAKCWAPEINAAFAGKLDGCNSDGTVSARPLHLACVRRVRERVQTSFMVSLFSIEAERGGESGEESSAPHYIGSATLTLSLSPSLSTEPPNINTATGYRFLCRVSDDGREHQQGRQIQRTALEMLCQLITASICFLSRSSLSSPPPGNVRCISSLPLCILIQCSSFISRFLIYECSLSLLAVNMPPPPSLDYLSPLLPPLSSFASLWVGRWRCCPMGMQGVSWLHATRYTL